MKPPVGSGAKPKPSSVQHFAQEQLLVTKVQSKLEEVMDLVSLLGPQVKPLQDVASKYTLRQPDYASPFSYSIHFSGDKNCNATHMVPDTKQMF